MSGFGPSNVNITHTDAVWLELKRPVELRPGVSVGCEVQR
jgi:hypothetical protein